MDRTRGRPKLVLREGKAVEILVDSRPYQTRDQSDQTLQELADEVCGKSGSGGGRLVVRLACDGAPVLPHQLEDVLGKPVRSFRSIELQTVSVRNQVAATLDQALEIFEQTGRIREQIADDLDQGRHESAMAGLQSLLEIFKQVQQTTFLSSQLLGISLESINIEGKDLTSMLAAIKGSLNDLKAGMENQDFVLVSDMLRYEFDEPINCWRSIISHLRSRID